MATIPNTQVSRRSLIAASGLVAAATLFRGAAEAQQPAADGFRPLRALPGLVPLRGPELEMTPIWGYSGVVPGPTLRIKREEELKVRLFNGLPTETAIHWHGVRLPNAFDGTTLTQRPVLPGASTTIASDRLTPDLLVPRGAAQLAKSRLAWPLIV